MIGLLSFTPVDLEIHQDSGISPKTIINRERETVGAAFGSVMIIGQLTCIDLSLSKRVADAQSHAVQFQHTVSRQDTERIDQFDQSYQYRSSAEYPW
jgi:hypothetical protein